MGFIAHKAGMLRVLREAAAADKLYTFRLPGFAPSELMSVNDVFLGDAIKAWQQAPEDNRPDNFRDLQTRLKHARKRHYKRGLRPGLEQDTFASDCALWLAHEILYSDGEKWIVKMPAREIDQSFAEAIAKEEGAANDQ